MPSLSAVDQAFFMLETAERPMNVGALLVLQPPGGGQRGFSDRLVRRMLACPVGPPFNYLLKPGPVPPLLALEERHGIDPRRQVHRHALRRGSDLGALFKRICVIHPQLLPRNEPLWQMHVFTGLPGGRVALYFKTHHGLIDGIGFIRIVMGMVSESSRPEPPHAVWEGMHAVAAQPSREQPRPAPGAVLLHTANEARRTASDLVRLALHQGLRGLGLGSGLAAPFVATPNVLKVAPSRNRALAHCTVPLAQVKQIAARAEAKVNDVMLAAIDVAMNRHLADIGTPPDRPLVADVPVALHDDGGTGNRITILQVPMGQPGSDAVERLSQIVRETREMKREVRALSGSSLMLYSIFEHSVASTIESLGLGELPMLANVVVSNPAGLDRRVFFNGAPVELALPVSVVGAQQVLNVTVTTYVDDLHVTFIALREALPDLARLAGYTVDAVDQLAAAYATKPRRGGAARSPAARRRGKRSVRK